MISLKSQFKDYDESQPFHELINLRSYIDDHKLLTKSGDVIVVLRLRSLMDAESLERSELDRTARHLTNALGVFDEGFTVNLYWRKQTNSLIEEEHCADSFTNAALRNRREFLSARRDQLFFYETHCVVTCTSNWRGIGCMSAAQFGRGLISSIRALYSTPAQVNILDGRIAAATIELEQATNSFIEQINTDFEVRVLTRREGVRFLRRLMNPNREKADAVGLKRNSNIDFQIVDSELRCYHDHLRLGESFVKVYTLKEPPFHTFAHMMSELTEVSADLTVVSEWQPWDASRSVPAIRAKRRHAHNTKVGVTSHLSKERPYEREILFDDAKEGRADDLGRCLKEIETNDVQVGEYSLTFVVHASTLAAAERAGAEIARVVGRYEGALNEETYNSLNALLASWPGGGPFNLRRLLVVDRNHVDLGLWWTPAAGEPRNAFLGTPALIALETEQRSLFHLNLHVEDVAHALVLGMTGAGKSFLLNCLITHAQKYRPLTFILDFGGSYEWLTKAMGGSFIALNPEHMPFTINPFALEATESNRRFQFMFVKVLIESKGHRMNEEEEQELFDGIEALSFLPASLQRLGTLATTLSRSLGRLLIPWTEGGPYGAYFDNVEDTVSFSPFQCLDFEGLAKIGPPLEPLLLYVLHRWNDLISDSSKGTEFKICVVDEAWRFLAHPVTCDYIVTAMKTWRKKNAAMILATQSATDITDSDALRPILDNCPTKILLANPNLDSHLYGEVLRLTADEQERIRELVPKRQFLLKQGDISKILNLNVDLRSYWLFTTNPLETKRRDEAIAATGSLDAALDFLTRGER